MEEQTYIDELTNILLKIRAIDPEAAKGLEEAFARSSVENFDEFLLSEGLVAKEGLLKALSMLYEVPCIDVDGYFFERFLLHKFPKDFLLRNVMIPYEQDQNILIMVAADPSQAVTLLDQIGEYVSYDIRFQVGLYTDIIDAVEMFYDKSPTDSVEEDQVLRVEDLDTLAKRQQDRDESVLIKQRIDEFVTQEQFEHDLSEGRGHTHKKR